MNDMPDPSKWKFDATPEELRVLYEKARAEFTEADLLKFFTEEEGVLFDDLIAELESRSNGTSQGSGT